MPVGQLNVANVYLGWDSRETQAYEVAYHSIVARASCPVRVTPIRLVQLEQQGLIRRPRQRLRKGRSMVISEGRVDRHVTAAASAGTLWDDISGAPMSTEFAISRFAALLLAQTGWALFADADIVSLGDIAELFALADPRFAVMVVKHAAIEGQGMKMDGQPQLPYSRKNWSSVMLFNCDHPGNRNLTLDMLNRKPGRDLHRFCWLQDHEIGALPLAWNWLVNIEPCPADVKLAHFTLGGPWLPDWSRREHDEIWLSAAQAVGTGSRADRSRNGSASMPDGC